jgi:lipopolysaccharide/colanic/teichoic acid biosynthesis glycosyltransferase
MLIYMREYLLVGFFYTTEVRKVLASFVIGMTTSFVVIGTIWLIRSNVYAQSEMMKEPLLPFQTFHWFMSGSIASVFIGFARVKYRLGKRLLDSFIAVCSLILLAPLFFILALLIKLESAGPVFFRQVRVGEKGKRFIIWKFRTMRHNAELETGPVWAGEKDPRITRLGEFLRKTHLDELPQLLNVVRGEMSIIGPRPERPEMLEVIEGTFPYFRERLHVKPGITGLAQVRYQYGASLKDATRKLRYDLIYIKRMCWLLDFQIILWTIGRVVTGEGAR